MNNAFIVWIMIHVEKYNINKGLKIQELQAETTTAATNEWTLFLMCPVLLLAWSNSPAPSQPHKLYMPHQRGRWLSCVNSFGVGQWFRFAGAASVRLKDVLKCALYVFPGDGRKSTRKTISVEGYKSKHPSLLKSPVYVRRPQSSSDCKLVLKINSCWRGI